MSAFPPREPLYVAAQSPPYHGGLGVGQLLTWQLASKGAKAEGVRPSQDPGQEQAPLSLMLHSVGSSRSLAQSRHKGKGLHRHVNPRRCGASRAAKTQPGAHLKLQLYRTELLASFF